MILFFKKASDQSLIVFFGVLALFSAAGNAIAESEGNLELNRDVVSYHSPLDLVSKITEIEIILEKEVAVDHNAGSRVFSESNGYDFSHHSPLDLVAKITEEAEPVNNSHFQENDELSQPLEKMADPSFTVSNFEDIDDPFADEHPEYPPISDPFEGYNRFMYTVNDGIFEYLVEPIARNYAEFVHEEIRLAIKNLFTNIGAPVRLFSSIIQGDIGKSLRVVERFLLNSTVGIGGLFDVAGNYYELESVNEDFGQALGHYDVGTGPYLVLPFFGPSSFRNVVGRVVDTFLSPTILFSPSFAVAAGITGSETLNSASFIYQGYNSLKQDAVDPYVSMRDFQHQYREKLVHE